VGLDVGVLSGVWVGRWVRVGSGVHEGAGVALATAVMVGEGSASTTARVGVDLSVSGNPLKSDGDRKATR
jgi:hypothetical protein